MVGSWIRVLEFGHRYGLPWYDHFGVIAKGCERVHFEVMTSTKYVAFLRGINVGGNALVKMTELTKVFESLGFKNVVPVLASGNVVFETAKPDPAVLKRRIEEMLARKVGVPATVILRTASQISELMKSNPFQGTKLSPQMKVQVTFLDAETKKGAKFPTSLNTKEFRIARVSSGEVCSIVDLSTNARTPELMRVLEKQFGKDVTTRTWTTIEKVAKVLKAE
jgi:uncharacterized protein (DUF1697 family)